MRERGENPSYIGLNDIFNLLKWKPPQFEEDICSNFIDIDVIDEKDEEDEEGEENKENKENKEVILNNTKISKNEYDITINNIDYIIKSFFNSNNIFKFYNKEYLIHSYLWDDKYKLTNKSNCKITVTLYVYEEDLVTNNDKKYLFNKDLSCKIKKDKLYNDFFDLLGYQKENDQELKYRIRRKRYDNKKNILYKPPNYKYEYRYNNPYNYGNTYNKYNKYNRYRGGYKLKNKSIKIKKYNKKYKTNKNITLKNIKRYKFKKNTLKLRKNL